jgi:polysaccharide biosynthesis transport protein
MRIRYRSSLPKRRSTTALEKVTPSNGLAGFDNPVRPPYAPPPPPVIDAHAAPVSPLVQGVRSLLRWKWTLVMGAVLGLMGGLAYSLVTLPVYRAATTVEVLGLNESFMGMSSIDPQAGTGNSLPTAINLQTQLKIIESGTLRGLVQERLERETTPLLAAQSGFLGQMRARLGLNPKDPLQSMRAGLAMAHSTLAARIMTGTRIIIISADSNHPELAASFVNAVASEYLAQNLQVRSASSQKTTQWLSGQLEETKAKLEQAERRLQEYVRKSGNLFVADADTLAATKLKDLQSEASAAQAERIAKQTRYEMTLKNPPDAIPDVQSDLEVKGYQLKLVDLQRERAALLATFTPEHYKVARVDAQIAEMERAVRRVKNDIVARMKNEYDAAMRREQALQGAYGGQSAVLGQQNDRAVEYGLMKREVEMLRQSLTSMLQQANQAGVVAAAPTSNVRVLDPARSSGAPVRPAPALHLMQGLFMGLFGVAGLVLLVEQAGRWRRQDKFAAPGDTAGALSVPELAVIPSAPVAGTAVGDGMRRRLGASPGLAGPVELVTWNDKPSMWADSFRMALASIRLMDRSGKRPKSFIVTSSSPAEGKTAISTNLAITMAESGKRVLIVDADLRRARLHDIFSVSNDRGLYTMLENRASITEIEGMIQETQIPGLSVLVAGPADPDHVGRVFHASWLPELLKRCEARFDTVVIDTPPMMMFSEARLLGGLVDGAILVIRASATDRQTALMARQRLADDGILVLGTILNDWDPGEKMHKYKNYYYQKK